MLKKTILLGCLMMMNRAQGAEFILDFFGAKELAYSLDLLERTESITTLKAKEELSKGISEIKETLSTKEKENFSKNEKHDINRQNTAKGLTITSGIISTISRLLLFKATIQNSKKLHTDTENREITSNDIKDYLMNNGFLPLLATTILSQIISKNAYAVREYWKAMHPIYSLVGSDVIMDREIQQQ